MLVVTRKVGQRVLVGDDIFIKVMKIEGNQVSIGIEAPADVPIDREEIRERKLRERTA